MKYLQDIVDQIQGKRVVLRVDYNVPLDNEKILDPIRIIETIPTIKAILENRPRYLVIISHLGRPQGQKNLKFSLKLIKDYLQKELNLNIQLIPNFLGNYSNKVHNFNEKGQPNIFLLENIRFFPEEENNCEIFGQRLSELSDIFVNDAFGVCHRSHSSIVGINAQQKVAGFLIQKEIQLTNQITSQRNKNLVSILGGSKIQDKLQLILNLIENSEHILIGGAMAHPFLSYMHQNDLGQSLNSINQHINIEKILRKCQEFNTKLHLPVDCICATYPDSQVVKFPQDVPNDHSIFDIGPVTLFNYQKIIEQAQMIFFNGAMGLFEKPQFSFGSVGIFMMIQQKNGLIAGGDTISIRNRCLLDKKNLQKIHLSTGGGVVLELLSGKKLEGLEFLN